MRGCSPSAGYWFLGGRSNHNLCCTTFAQGRMLETNGRNNLPYNGFFPVLDNDFTRLDLSAWRHVDAVVSRLEARGAVWFSFDGCVPNVGADLGAQRTDFEAQKVCDRNVVTRLAPYWNLIWNLAFEWAEFLTAAQVHRLAGYVRSLDPWHHPLTVHDQGPFETGPQMVERLGVDFPTLQYQAGTCGDALRANALVRQYAGSFPVYAQEVCWEGTTKYPMGSRPPPRAKEALQAAAIPIPWPLS